MADQPGRDFFISYTAVNRPWAEWIAVQLEAARYTTVLQAWDFRPGNDFLHEMQQATSTAGRTIAVLSPAYFGSKFSEAEWRAAFAKDPTGERGLLVPVRVQECQPPGLLASRVYIDLVDTDEPTAKQRLLAGVGEAGARPTSAPFPGAARGSKRFPGQGPEISNLPARNPNFSGRDDLLKELHASLQAGLAAAVVPRGALHGLGGVGKTELALEFAHRFASDYDIAWWIPAELPTSATTTLAALARRLGVEDLADQSEMVTGLFERLRQRDRWLLIYDNAERPDRLAGLLPPGGGGQVLVTSRWSAWGSQATPLRVTVLARDESIAFLGRRTGADDKVALDALAELLGDLPLALEEAAVYLEETHIDIGEYLELVRERARELFGLDQPPDDEHGDQRRVATVWSLSLERVHQQARAAEALLRLCAFLAPQDIPRDLPREHAEVLPDELAGVVGDVLAYNRLLAAVSRFSLATVTSASLGLHRLVQAVLQARLGPAGERAWAAAAVHLLYRSFPTQSWEVATWQRCAQLLPHALTVAGHAERLGVAGEQAGWLLGRASSYLRGRGLYRQARPIAEQALALTEAALGPEDVGVAWRCDELGQVLQALGDLAGARMQLERAVEIGEATLGPHHPTVATSRNNLGLVLWDLGALDDARMQLEWALEIGEAASGLDHRTVASRRNNLGLVLQDLGALDGARVQLEQALEIGGSALGPDHPTVARWNNGLGLVLQDLGDLDGARVQLERALEIGGSALGPDHPDMATWHSNLGGVLRDLGDLKAAQAQLERALRISEAALGANHPNVATIRSNLGGVLWDLGNVDGARVQYERVLVISEAALGPNHPYVAIRRNDLGHVLQVLGDLEGARAQLERALEIGEAALGPNHPYVATYRNNLGRVLQDLGDLASARVQLERALEVGEAALGPDHPDVAILRDNLGLTLQGVGDLEGAQTQHERALAISEVALGPDHLDVATRRGNLGGVLEALGDLEGAREQLERALAIGEAALGPDDLDVAVWRNNLGNVLHELGDLEGARAQLEQALATAEATLGPSHPDVTTIRGHLNSVLQALQEVPPKGPASSV